MSFRARVKRILSTQFRGEMLDSSDFTFDTLTLGRAGNAGAVTIYSSTSTAGYLQILQSDAALTSYNTTITNATKGQATTITIPDPQAATAAFIMAGQGTYNPITSICEIGQSASTSGSGVALDATYTKAFGVYADDGGAAIGSGTLIRAGRFRTLLTYTGGNREQEACGVIGQINSVGGTNRHNMCGVMGSYELSGSSNLVVDGQAWTTDPWIQAAVIGRVGVGSSKTTLNTNGVLAGVAAMSNTTAFTANNGYYTGLFVGKWNGTTDWGYGLVIDGAAIATAGIAFIGATERAIDFGAMTTGTTTDGVLIRAGTGIGTSGLAFGTASQRAIALYLRPTATTGTFTGMRLRSIADPASGSSLSMDNLLCQASVVENKNAATVNSAMIEFIPKGTNTIETGRCLLCNADSAASQTMTTQIIGHFRVHTRGDETITTDEMLRLENEAVGGNGRALNSAIRIMDTNVNASGFTAAVDIDAQCERAFDLGGMTCGTTTDGVIMRVGTGIGTSGMAFATANQRAFALYLRPTASSGTFTGVRLRSIADPSSGTHSINNFHCQTSIIANKDAAVVNSAFIELIPKGTNTIDYGRGLLVTCDSAATVTYTTGLTLAHIRAHTRGDETMSGVDELLRIENEAVGGNGRQMDSFIRCTETNISGGIKAAGYGIDFGTSTSMFATALFRIPDDEVVAWDDATGSGDTEAGAIKVIVGAATRYIVLYSDAPA